MAQIRENRLMGLGSSWIRADCGASGGDGRGGVWCLWRGCRVNPPQSWSQSTLKEESLPAK